MSSNVVDIIEIYDLKKFARGWLKKSVYLEAKKVGLGPKNAGLGYEIVHFQITVPRLKAVSRVIPVLSSRYQNKKC